VIAQRPVGEAVDALRDLLEILKPHADVKPIQHMFGLWRDAPLNRAKTGRAVGKNGDRGAFVHA
jgi:hypothetical protein